MRSLTGVAVVPKGGGAKRFWDIVLPECCAAHDQPNSELQTVSDKGFVQMYDKMHSIAPEFIRIDAAMPEASIRIKKMLALRPSRVVVSKKFR